MVGRKSFQLVLTLISVTFFVFAVPANAKTCAEQLDGLSHEVIFRELSSPTISVQAVLAELSKDKKIHDLMESSSGVSEGFTVREHVAIAMTILLEQFDRYRARFQLSSFQNIRLLPTLVITLALHDIGKPLAVAAGDKDRQHEFTVPILIETMQRLKFRREEIDLAKALVDNHVVGRLVRGQSVGPQAFLEMSFQASRAHLSVPRFAPLQLLFYASDAGAYPVVRNTVLYYDHGVLLPKNVDILSYGIRLKTTSPRLAQ